jgi:DNA-binding transcriptional MerR regulator
MNPATTLYRIGGFAERAGVTVRALRHYHKIGLLVPRARSLGRYRLYGEQDLVTLQQIVTLRFIGFSLREIRQVLRERRRKVTDLLALQRRALEERRTRLDRIIEAIREAERAVERKATRSFDRFQYIVEVIAMEQKKDVLEGWYQKYYSPEQMEAFKQRKWTPEDQERAGKEWKEIFAEGKKLIGMDPAAPQVQALAVRWWAMVSQFTQGDPGIERSVDAMYADRRNWPKEAYQHLDPAKYPAEVFEFMAKAVEIYRKRAGTP